MSPRRLFVVALASMSLVTMFGCAAQGTSVSEPAQNRIEELERENAELGRRIGTLEEQLAAALRGEAHVIRCDAYPPIDATVLDVSAETRMVVLDRGRNAEVKVGYVFDVFRDSTYKGQVRVERVEETTCSGRILRQINPITKGDSATTQL